MGKGALEGIKVFFIGGVWAGPICAQLLSDMGAQVILQESHTYFTVTRVLQSPDNTNLESGPQFQTLNRNFLSVTLDLKRPGAVELAKRIIKISDVFLENNAPQTLRKFGLDYSVVKETNPSIVMCSMSIFGQTGPLAPMPGYGTGITAISGLGSLYGYHNDEVPLGSFWAYSDLASAVTAFSAIVAALHYRERTGKGQHIDLSEWEATNVLMGTEFLDYLRDKREPSLMGNRSSWMAPHGIYRCRGEDKWIAIACATEAEWKALCTATGNPDWAEEDRFADVYSRLKNQDELDKLITDWTTPRTDYEITEILQTAGVAAIPVFSVADMFTDPHCQSEDYLVHLPHPYEPASYVQNIPWKLSETPGGIRAHAPLLGQHSEYVLCDLCGLSKDEFAKLVDAKVIW